MERLVDRVGRHWEARRQAEAAAARAGQASLAEAWTVALAREAGTQGTAVGHEVGRRLGWPVYDHELLERIAQEMGLRTNLLESVDERRGSWLEEALEDFLAVPLVSESAYVQHVIRTVLALGIHGECVIVGRGAAHILPPRTTLRVRLVAPLAERVSAVEKQLGISRQAADRRIRALDREYRRFVQDHFLHNPADPEGYDLVLNASRFAVAECADLIIEALNRVKAPPAADR
jgi:cytidylate kinase